MFGKVTRKFCPRAIPHGDYAVLDTWSKVGVATARGCYLCVEMKTNAAISRMSDAVNVPGPNVSIESGKPGGTRGFVTCFTTRAYDGFILSRFGPTRPVARAALSM